MKDLTDSSLILIGVGGTASLTVRGVHRAYGGNLRALAIDTDASTGASGEVDFALLGGNRLAGRGSGGQAAQVRAAFQDDPAFIDAKLEGVRTAVVVTALGGGTANGATGELLKHLNQLGVTALVFATLPFSFEGEERNREARAALGSVASHADALAAMPMDLLVTGANSDNFRLALQQAADTLASGVTLLWRILEKPGYIRLDSERLRHLLASAGNARFAAVSAAGERRAELVLEQLRQSALLAAGPAARPIRKILLGILAGDDLRLSEIARLVEGIQSAFAPGATLELGTVNDEATFSGRLAVTVLLFEENAVSTAKAQSGDPARRQRHLSGGERALVAADRFGSSEKTCWNDENLDIPTYLRRNLTLER